MSKIKRHRWSTSEENSINELFNAGKPLNELPIVLSGLVTLKAATVRANRLGYGARTKNGIVRIQATRVKKPYTKQKRIYMGKTIVSKLPMPINVGFSLKVLAVHEPWFKFIVDKKVFTMKIPHNNKWLKRLPVTGETLAVKLVNYGEDNTYVKMIVKKDFRLDDNNAVSEAIEAPESNNNTLFNEVVESDVETVTETATIQDLMIIKEEPVPEIMNVQTVDNIVYMDASMMVAKMVSIMRTIAGGAAKYIVDDKRKIVFIEYADLGEVRESCFSEFIDSTLKMLSK